jgi:hypothetical protein
VNADVLAGVLHLMGAYGSLLDRLVVDEWLDLFDEPSVLGINGKLLETRAQRLRLTATAPRGLHVTNLPLVGGDPGSGRVSSHATFFFWNLEESSALAGWYDDELVDKDGRWLFTSRRISFLGD